MSVTAVYPVTNCSPAGLTLGPRNEAMIGCGGSFGTAPNVVTQSIVINLDNGNVEANITQAVGNDEVWYDKGTQHYYLAARATQTPDGTVTPILATVDAKTNTFDGGVATSTTAHSVAADRRSNHVFGTDRIRPPGQQSRNGCNQPLPNERMHRCVPTVF